MMNAVEGVRGAIRKATGSTGASPEDSKRVKKDEAGMEEEAQEELGEEEDMDVTKMMKVMMKDMKEMKWLMKTNSADIKEAKDEARSASQTAVQAMMTASAVEKEVQQLKESAVTKENVEEVVKASLNQLNPGLQNTTGKTNSTTILLGGLEHKSAEEAKAWVNRLLLDGKAAQPQDAYKKGKRDEEFKGLLFMKFANESQAEFALQVCKDKCDKENMRRPKENRLWANYDAPVEERTVNSFLLSLRWQLLEWGFDKKYIKVELEQGIMKAGGKEVLKVEVKESAFKLEWVNKTWGEWEALCNSPEYGRLVEKANEKLAKSKEGMNKGAGKGSQ